MLKPLALALAVMLLGCAAQAQPQLSKAPDTATTNIHRFLAGAVFEYIVDANLRHCYFGHVANGSSLDRIDCQKLKRAVPVTASVITWKQ